jgi:hypothetical protein
MTRRLTDMPDKKNQHNNGLFYRSAPLDILNTGVPSTLDEATRSVEVIASTENPVSVMDYERWEVINEVLLMRGCKLPKNRQIPLLDTHQRYDTSAVIGSYREMKIENDKLIGRSFFSTVEKAESSYTKVKEGHLTDFSIGYKPLESVWIPANETQIVDGRSFTGPLKVVTSWLPKELSACPIGADEDAKARSEYNQNYKEVNKMEEKLRKFLEGRGLANSATEAEAWAFLEKLDLRKDESTQSVRTAPVDTKSMDEARAEGARVEQARITEIRAMCGRFECADIADALITGNKGIDEARKAVMDYLDEAKTKEKSGQREIGFFGEIRIGVDERDKFRSATEDALMLRSGANVEKPAPGAEELRGYSLVEMARMALKYSNQNSNGRPLEMVGRALTTSDFPYLLANVANKSLFQGWNTQTETWNQWCATGQVSDFKQNYSVRISESSDLDEIPEDTEYKYGKRTEAQETYQIATYGKIFALSRQVIINDDLNALTNIPQSHGEAAARKVGDVAYAVLTANAVMGDGVALFNATHSNIAVSGDIAPPGISTLAAAILAMGTQKDLQGLRRLNIRPEFFIAPRALEGVSEVFFKSEKFSDNSTPATDSTFASSRTNPYSGTYFKRIYESRLDDNSPAYWYLAAQKGKTVTVFFLNGVQAPYMETKQGWTVDGVEYKVRIDVGAKALDWRGLYLNPDT